MNLTTRTYSSDEDYWRIRTFLRKTFLLHDRHERNWPLYRFDYWRWHILENLTRLPLEEAIFMWETPDGELASVINADGLGEAAFQIHPVWKSEDLMEALVAVAEERLAKTNDDGTRSLTLFSDSQDSIRCQVFERRGYTRQSWTEYQRRRCLDIPIPEVSLPAGFCLRPLRDGTELLERCYASGLAFHPDEIEIALGNRAEVTWYRNIQNAPLYRRDLDLVAVSPDGEVAAFTTIWFDDVTRTGSFEPVATVPAFRRRGLARALMLEGLRRLKRLGATLATVSSYSDSAGALYASVGFEEYDQSDPWEKVW